MSKKNANAVVTTPAIAPEMAAIIEAPVVVEETTYNEVGAVVLETPRNGHIADDRFLEIYLDVVEEGGTMEDLIHRLRAEPGQVKFRKPNEIATKVLNAKRAGFDLPKLAGQSRRKDDSKKQALLARLAALKAKK